MTDKVSVSIRLVANVNIRIRKVTAAIRLVMLKVGNLRTMHIVRIGTYYLNKQHIVLT